MALLEEIEKTNQSIRHHYAAHDQGAPILRVADLWVGYDAGRALEGISFEVPRAMQLAIVGPNGAGKSTLIKTIAGIIPPARGTVKIFGKDPGQHICVAYVPQRSQVDWNFPVSVRDVVMMGRIGKLGLLRRPKRADWEAVEQALETVNLPDLAHRQIGELSGGQQQRMFLARALAQEAELALMDEPLTGLDLNAQQDILTILSLLRDRNVTVLVALHDLKLAAERFDAVMLLNHRLIGIGSPAEAFSPANLAEAYGAFRVSSGGPWLAVDDDCCGEEEGRHG
jgi:manganese/iron transport system ATP-binding protein